MSTKTYACQWEEFNKRDEAVVKEKRWDNGISPQAFEKWSQKQWDKPNFWRFLRTE